MPARPGGFCGTEGQTFDNRDVLDLVMDGLRYGAVPASS
jgi:hypothetical protein